MLFYFVLVEIMCYSQLSLGMHIVKCYEANSKVDPAISTSYPEISTLSSQNFRNDLTKNTDHLQMKLLVAAVRK